MTGDRRVNNTDVGAVQSMLGVNPISIAEPTQIRSDLTLDGRVNNTDVGGLMTLRGEDGRGSSPTLPRRLPASHRSCSPPRRRRLRSCYRSSLRRRSLFVSVAAADVQVRDGGSAAKNYGLQSTLEVKKSSLAGSSREAYLRFDTSAASVVNSVKLRLFGKLSDSSASKVALGVYSSTNTSWGETRITWNNRPSVGTVLQTMTVTGTGGQWFELDLTSFIQSERPPDARSSR